MGRQRRDRAGLGAIPTVAGAAPVDAGAHGSRPAGFADVGLSAPRPGPAGVEDPDGRRSRARDHGAPTPTGPKRASPGAWPTASAARRRHRRALAHRFAGHLLVLHGFWEHQPSALYPAVEAPVLFVAAAASEGTAEAVAALPKGRVRPLNADHDVHAQKPGRWPAPCSAPSPTGSCRDHVAAPGDHGLGRDQPDDGQDTPAAARAGRRHRPGRPPRHAVRLPGERRRHRRPRGRVLRRERRALDRRRQLPIRRRRRGGLRGLLEPCGRPAYVFGGPGGPSYALRQWRGSPIPELLRDKLRDGGCVTFASAAALTLGLVTVPVYEIYKVGEEPRWLDGLDLLGAAGLSAAVIPHYDNAEGGTHDTRFCYLGERRLADARAAAPRRARSSSASTSTPPSCSTSTAATVTVEGLGTVTVRHRGQSRSELPAGTTVIAGLPRPRQGRGPCTATAATASGSRPCRACAGMAGGPSPRPAAAGLEAAFAPPWRLATMPRPYGAPPSSPSTRRWGLVGPGHPRRRARPRQNRPSGRRSFALGSWVGAVGPARRVRSSTS